MVQTGAATQISAGMWPIERYVQRTVSATADRSSSILRTDLSRPERRGRRLEASTAVGRVQGPRSAVRQRSLDCRFDRRLLDRNNRLKVPLGVDGDGIAHTLD